MSVVEPGENWKNESFRHSRVVNPIAGWQLGKNWLTKAGFGSGFVTLEYYSGEGKGLFGCRPCEKTRLALRYV